MNTLHALVMRCCFRGDHPMNQTLDGKAGHGIRDCDLQPSVEEQAGMDRSVWVTRWGGTGPSGKDTYLVKLARQQRVDLGATYVTSTSSQPYTHPGVPGPLNVLSGSVGPGLHAIPVPDTSPASLMTISNLTSMMCIQTESMDVMQLQVDTMIHTVRPQHLLTISVPTPPVSADTVSQIYNETPVGYVRGGVLFDNEAELFFLPSDCERLTTPLENLGQVSGGRGAAGGEDTSPLVLLACVPDDYIHGGTYVDGRMPLWFHLTAASRVPGLQNRVGGRY